MAATVLDVAIVGAGFGGILAGLRLKNDLKCSNFTIFEKASDIGGTWRDNSYPGCSVDVSAHAYSISSELNPNWSKVFPEQPEILQYQHDVVERNGLYAHIQLRSKILSCTWDESRQGYSLKIEQTSTDASTTSIETVFARILIQAVGNTHIPKPPSIKGLETFKGSMFHSAEWDWSTSLEGKRIGVIGNGASAAQIVPALAKDRSIEVWNFCRTPQWFATRPQGDYGRVYKWVYANVPLVQRAWRGYLYLRYEAQYLALPAGLGFIRKPVEWYFRRYMRSQAPEKYHDVLLPKYPIGCKRVIRDPGYLSCFHQPNVHLTFDPITSITPTGLVISHPSTSSTQSPTEEEIPLDILVLSTGFDTTASSALTLTGRSDLTLRSYWEKEGGPTAYRGVTVPGFPNMFMLLGPNTGTGHTSTLFGEEAQVDYTMKIVKALLEKNSTLTAIEVAKSACDAYNVWLQKDLKGMVWEACTSYYNQDGKKNVILWPGSMTGFRWSLNRVKWKDYILTRQESAVVKDT